MRDPKYKPLKGIGRGPIIPSVPTKNQRVKMPLNPKP